MHTFYDFQYKSFLQNKTIAMKYQRTQFLINFADKLLYIVLIVIGARWRSTADREVLGSNSTLAYREFLWDKK